VDEHELGPESIVIVDVRVLYYNIPEDDLNILPVSILFVPLLVLKSELSSQIGPYVLSRE
jgi:hypothetical protein